MPKLLNVKTGSGKKLFLHRLCHLDRFGMGPRAAREDDEVKKKRLFLSSLSFTRLPWLH